jgi:hypothetical protein
MEYALLRMLCLIRPFLWKPQVAPSLCDRKFFLKDIVNLRWDMGVMKCSQVERKETHNGLKMKFKWMGGYFTPIIRYAQLMPE